MPSRNSSRFSIVLVLAFASSAATVAFAQTSAPDSLSLEEVVGEALRANPEIAEARAKWRAAEARVPATGALEDPALEFMLDRQPIGDGMAGEKVISLTQMIPFPGKLGLMSGEARREAEASKEMAREMVRRVVSEVKESYFELYMIESQIGAMRESRSAVDAAVSGARARYETGDAGQQEILLLQVELSVLDGEIARMEAMAHSARAKLNLLLAREAEAPLRAPRVAGLSAFDARLEDLIARGREVRPAVRAREREKAAAETAARLARVEYRPDFMLRGGYMRMAEDEQAWQAAVGITLPLWKGRKQDALARAAGYRVEAADRALEAERNRAAAEIEDEYAQLVANRELAHRYADEIIPLADMAYESARAGYLSGRESFLVLLESVRRITELKTTYYEYLAQAETRLALLERAVGEDLGGIRLGPDAGLDEGKD